MCRLFGFRSNAPSSVHRSLVHEQNSLRQQSLEHKDGWGIASYAACGTPTLAHGLGAAHSDPEFERVSGRVSSATVLAHVRLASVGPVHIRNAHPFVFERWTFAHNGTVRDFAQHRQTFEAEIDPRFLHLIQGETDSERCFYLFLTYLFGSLKSGDEPDARAVAQALARTAQLASYVTRHAAHPKPTSVNFLVTNGRVMAATRRHRTLFFSEQNLRASGPHSAPRSGTRVPQLIIASEELSFEAHWHEIPEEGVLALEEDLTLERWRIGELAPLSG